MEFRKIAMTTLYARQEKRHRCKEQSFGLCVRAEFYTSTCTSMTIVVRAPLDSLLFDSHKDPMTWKRGYCYSNF